MKTMTSTSKSADEFSALEALDLLKGGEQTVLLRQDS